VSHENGPSEHYF